MTDVEEKKNPVEENSHPELEKEAEDSDGKGDCVKEILRAAEKNEIDTLRELLEQDPSLVNATDSDMYTPLHRACYGNHVEVIKVLLSYEANVGARTVDGWEPLHCACKWDCVEAASILLQNGADVNALTSGKLSPLHLAAANASGRRTLELLLWHPFIDGACRNEGIGTAYETAYRSSPFSGLFEILDESINIY